MSRSVVRRRRGVTLPAVLLLAVLLLGGGAGSSRPDARVQLPAGVQLFASRPLRADCARADIAALRAMTGVDEPSPEAILTSQQGQPADLTWAGCVGWQPASSAAATGSDPAARAVV